jgi:hypothetical protein
VATDVFDIFVVGGVAAVVVVVGPNVVALDIGNVVDADDDTVDWLEVMTVSIVLNIDVDDVLSSGKLMRIAMSA